MRLLAIFILLFSAPLMSGCVILPVAAVGGLAAETATADSDPNASNGIVAEQWQAACAEVGGKLDPKTGDCDGDLIGYLLNGKPAPTAE